jgi:UDP-glucose 4-epimerase
MKILILGSKGFIGSHLYSYFISCKENIVFGCDTLGPEGQKNYFKVDKLNPDYKSILKTQQFDICINASGGANVSSSVSCPDIDFSLNVINVFKILHALKECDITCKFIQLSSAAVYGNPLKLPIEETDSNFPISPYGFHKLQSEKLCEEFYKIYGLPSVVMRIFSVYGPGLRKQLFWDLYQKSKKNSEVTLSGTGQETRDFIYIDDFVDVVELVANNFSFNGDTINIANGIEYSISSAASIFLKNFKTKTKVHFIGNNKVGDPTNWRADISQLKSLGYRPKYSLEKGLAKYTEWLKKLR